jgi:MFS family permease
MARTTSPVVRHLTVAQGLSIAGSSVDLTLTGIVGARIAPTPALATLPFSVIFLAAGLSTFVVSRAIGRFGYRRVFIVVAGFAAAASDAVGVYLLAMFAIGLGWNLAYGGGSALIAASYQIAERGRVQPVAEILIIGAQVAGSLSASAYTTAAGWRILGWGCVALGCAVAASLGLSQFRRRIARTTTQSG